MELLHVVCSEVKRVMSLIRLLSTNRHRNYYIKAVNFLEGQAVKYDIYQVREMLYIKEITDGGIRIGHKRRPITFEILENKNSFSRFAAIKLDENLKHCRCEKVLSFSSQSQAILSSLSGRLD